MTIAINRSSENVENSNRVFSEILRNQESLSDILANISQLEKKIMALEDLFETQLKTVRDFASELSSKISDFSSFTQELPLSQEMILSNIFDSLSGFKSDIVLELMNKLTKLNEKNIQSVNVFIKDEIQNLIKNSIKNEKFSKSEKGSHLKLQDNGNLHNKIKKDLILLESQKKLPKIDYKKKQSNNDLKTAYYQLDGKSQSLVYNKINFLSKVLKLVQANNNHIITIKTAYKSIVILSDIIDILFSKKVQNKELDITDIKEKIKIYFEDSNFNWILDIKEKIVKNPFDTLDFELKGYFMKNLQNVCNKFSFLKFIS